MTSNYVDSIYLDNCEPFKNINFNKSILSTETNGKLGNQISAFATAYGIARMTNNTFRVGINFKQYQILENAFPYFSNNFQEYLMDAWYCNTRPSQFQWTPLGDKNTKKARERVGVESNWNLFEIRSIQFKNLRFD